MCGYKDDIRLIADLFDGLLYRFIGSFKGCIVNAFLFPVPDRNIRCTDADNGKPDAAAANDRPAFSCDAVSLLVQDIFPEHREFGLSQNL